MFVSQESNKRGFQKPNILRRKTKAPVRVSGASNVSSSIESLTTRYDASASIKGPIINDLTLQTITKYTCVKPFQPVKNSVQQNVLHSQIETIDPKQSSLNAKYMCVKPIQSVEKSSVQQNILYSQSSQNVDNESGLLVNIVNENASNPVQPSVNVESFFNNGENRENVMLFTINPNKEIQSLVIIDNESHKDSLSNQPSKDLITSMVPLSAVSTPSVKARVKEGKPTPTTVVSPQQLFENTTLDPKKFKCDFPGCKKDFRSETKWKRHKNSHKRDGAIRVPRQVSVECPVKKIDSNGSEQRCGNIYLVREQLAKHLNEDHSLEDAAYRCEQCGRQFFWASGLRAHARAHAPQPRVSQSLACGWPGCGRVFTQPCRLREHARAHTGDKPYSCRYPNCNGSFRSASKLERHARRHTGLRRHACAACGRAFLRREHLRDHTARQHAQRRHHQIACTNQECEQTFETADALQEHITNMHAIAEEPPVPAAAPDAGESLLKNNLDYIFLVDEASDTAQEVEEKDDEECGDEVSEVEAGALRAARTHCPWPLAARSPPAHAGYGLDDDATVEQPEGSESNIYTVRSDLFLHGNVLINEDSVQMGGAVETAEAAPEPSAPNDELGLGLLEHPHIDLMQEEMMFTAWQ